MDTLSWMFNFVPWWVWLVIAGGGGGAILAFVPGALALVVSVWNMLPRPVKVVLGGIVAILVAYVAGRNKGSKDERDMNEKRGAQATAKRLEIKRDVQNLKPSEVDAQLKKHGDFRDE
jgi:hypothetical protein